MPVSAFDEDKFESGHAFDGSSIAGWKGIEASDMLLMPDPNTANIDPFYEESTLVLTVRRDRAGRRQGLRARPALARQARRSVPEELGPGRHRLLRSGTGILHFRLGPVEHGPVGLLRQDRLGRSAVVVGEGIRRRQHRPPSGHVKGGYFPVAPVDTLPGHALGNVPDARTDRHSGRSASPRSGGARARTKSAPSSRRWCSAPTGCSR